MSQVESQGEGEKHEIEAILQCVKEDGVYTFAVKWFGYPEKARDTVSFQYWEPYKNVKDLKGDLGIKREAGQHTYAAATPGPHNMKYVYEKMHQYAIEDSKKEAADKEKEIKEEDKN
ncbi:unnamed protein product [Vitrella brassicaformis CCMP3155]|uniref:Chromo domain-containing protein n=1 Tax=Vitrella brassicaformis (strain CCMP3155) TaxID=1169540 RepID=A0A0G4EE74_VITBC|nr:unnamed protein product [Vitrella brassicaformis CCMP3155]|eukprot:CEL94041.1 unnamed protein product [Vitrella brassicaformis CCMP3155]